MAKITLTSQKYSLTTYDLERWVRNTIIFSIPALIATLTSLQSGQNLEFALGAGYSALLGSLIDLARKYNSETKYTK